MRIHYSYEIIKKILRLQIDKLNISSSNFLPLCIMPFGKISKLLGGVLIVLSSCDNIDLKNNLPIVDLSKKVTKSEKDVGSDLIKVEDFFMLEFTDSSMLGTCYIVEDMDDTIILRDIQNVYNFTSSGAFINRINHIGDGPQEYLNVSDAVVYNNTINVFDLHKGKIFTYDMEGNYIQSLLNDSLLSITKNKNGHWITRNKSLNELNYSICLYDHKWNFLSGVKKNYSEIIESPYLVINPFMKFNDEIYSYDNDTIYRFTETCQMSPFLYISKANLSIPQEILYDTKRKKERMNYIWGENMCISSKYLFICYYYDYKKYYDVFDIDTGDLFFRNIVKDVNDTEGFPIEINNKQIYVWPSYVKNDIFYCIVDENVSQSLFDFMDAEYNPAIIKFTIGD